MRGGNWKRKKTYGEYKTKNCAFCGRMATQKNEQGVEVCHQHTKEQLPEIKCTCGSWLEQRAGKFGSYFNCLNCGNINYEKAMRMKETMGSSGVKKDEPVKKDYLKPEPKEITIDSRDPNYFS